MNDELRLRLSKLTQLYYALKHSDLPGMDQFRKCLAFRDLEETMEKAGVQNAS